MKTGDKKMNHIIPTVFATGKKEFDIRFNKLIRIAKDIQVDIMDGKFVRAKSVSIRDIPDLNKRENRFEAHLMTKNPEKQINALKKKGFKKIIFHYESMWNINNCVSLIYKIKSLNMEAWIAINPETSVAKVIPILYYADGVVLMGVHPGREHQSLAHRTYEKIRGIKSKNRKIRVQIDGGVNLDNISRLRRLEVNYFNSGSFVSEAEDPEKVLKELERAT